MNSLDKSKIKPIPIQKSAALINNFVLNTAVFLNSFAETVERKISIVSNKVTELEILLTVLEEKLNSVPGLEVEGSAPVPQASAPVSQPAPTTSATTAPPPSTPAPPSGPSSAPPPPALAAQEAPVEAPKPSLADDPDYAPFVKMIKVGVPKFVVVAKATAAGLDGARLEAFEP